MTYHILNIYDMLRTMDESDIQEMLSSFSCPLNSEVENYIHNQALEFTKRGISITYLVCALDENNHVQVMQIVGYYTIAYKVVQISKNAISRTTERKLSRFGEFNPSTATYTLPAPLIAQFGKNYTDNLNEKISGDKLMELALDQIETIHSLAGGRVVYLECENRPKLLDYYKRQGFTEFSLRYINEEEDNFYYHQLIKIMK